MKTKFEEKYGWTPNECVWLHLIHLVEEDANIGIWDNTDQMLFDAAAYFYNRVANEKRKKRIETLKTKIKWIKETKKRLPKDMGPMELVIPYHRERR